MQEPISEPLKGLLYSSNIAKIGANAKNHVRFRFKWI
tara:strand:- start:428 stop:538 length:111 start_codon:yes stop_codon:yes gene_type:complete